MTIELVLGAAYDVCPHPNAVSLNYATEEILAVAPDKFLVFAAGPNTFVTTTANQHFTVTPVTMKGTAPTPGVTKTLSVNPTAHTYPYVHWALPAQAIHLATNLNVILVWRQEWNGLTGLSSQIADGLELLLCDDDGNQLGSPSTSTVQFGTAGDSPFGRIVKINATTFMLAYAVNTGTTHYAKTNTYTVSGTTITTVTTGDPQFSGSSSTTFDIVGAIQIADGWAMMFVSMFGASNTDAWITMNGYGLGAHSYGTLGMTKPLIAGVVPQDPTDAVTQYYGGQGVRVLGYHQTITPASVLGRAYFDIIDITSVGYVGSDQESVTAVTMSLGDDTDISPDVYFYKDFIDTGLDANTLIYPRMAYSSQVIMLTEFTSKKQVGLDQTFLWDASKLPYGTDPASYGGIGGIPTPLDQVRGFVRLSASRAILLVSYSDAAGALRLAAHLVTRKDVPVVDPNGSRIRFA